MADVLNKMTLELRRSVNTPDFDPDEWLINPDLAPLSGVPTRYWQIIGDAVIEMSSEDKAAVDAAALADVRASATAALEAQFLDLVDQRYPSYRREALLSLLTTAMALGLTQRSAYIAQLQTWVGSGLTEILYPAQDAVHSAATAVDVAAVGLNATAWLASDPQVSVRSAMEILH